MESDKIRIKIRTMESETHDLTVEKSMKISELKKLIQEKTNVEPFCQRLVRGGKEL